MIIFTRYIMLFPELNLHRSNSHPITKDDSISLHYSQLSYLRLLNSALPYLMSKYIISLHNTNADGLHISITADANERKSNARRQLGLHGNEVRV